MARFKSTALYCENMMAEMKALSMLQNAEGNGEGGVETSMAMTQGRSICALEVLRMLGQSLDPRYAAIIDTIYMELANSIFSAENFEKYIESLADDESDSSDDEHDDDGEGSNGVDVGGGDNDDGNSRRGRGRSRRVGGSSRKESTIVITNISQLDNPFPERSSGGIKEDAMHSERSSDEDPAEDDDKNWHLSEAFDCAFVSSCSFLLLRLTIIFLLRQKMCTPRHTMTW